jgi:hypothetical protein
MRSLVRSVTFKIRIAAAAHLRRFPEQKVLRVCRILCAHLAGLSGGRLARFTAVGKELLLCQLMPISIGQNVGLINTSTIILDLDCQIVRNLTVRLLLMLSVSKEGCWRSIGSKVLPLLGKLGVHDSLAVVPAHVKTSGHLWMFVQITDERRERVAVNRN